MENSAEFYYEKLKNTNNPGPVLAAFIGVLYDVEVSRSEIIMCNRLIKVFGKYLTYFSIIDMVGSKPEKPDEMFGYLYTICKRRFELSHNDSVMQSRESLNSYLRGIDKELETTMKSKKKLRIPPAEGLGNVTG